MVPYIFSDFENVKKQIESEIDLSILESMENEIQVTCEDTAKQALSMALQSRKLEQTLEKSRCEIIKPHLEYQRSINKLVKDFQKKLELMENNLQKKIEVWMQESKENPFTFTNELQVEDGMIYTQDYWDFEIEDQYKIPREFLNIDDDLLKEAIKIGIRKIPGVRIFKKEKTIMRIKN